MTRKTWLAIAIGISIHPLLTVLDTSWDAFFPFMTLCVAVEQFVRAFRTPPSRFRGGNSWRNGCLLNASGMAWLAAIGWWGESLPGGVLMLSLCAAVAALACGFLCHRRARVRTA